MLFTCTATWEPSQEEKAINRRLEAEKKGDPLPSGVKLLGAWGYFGGGKAFMLVDVEDPAPFMGMCMAWSDVMRTEVAPAPERKDIKRLRSRSK